MLTVTMPRATTLPAPRRPAGPMLRPPVLTDAQCWQAVVTRDRSRAGAFVYAVRSTGVYCRPGCPSRRPRRDGVRFFPSPEVAEVEGFRPCRRCRPRDAAGDQPGVGVARRACAFLARHASEPVTLARVAAHVGLSPFHLQRVFSRVVGVSPRAYQEALKAAAYRSELQAGEAPAAAAYGAGYGSSSRISERKPTGSVTPARYRAGGKGLVVRYAVVESALGRLLVAGTATGVCAVKLGGVDRRLVDELRQEFPQATLEESPRALAPWTCALQQQALGRIPDTALPLDVRGTAFQWQVWRYLQSIPLGETRSYSEVARAIRRPPAVRAVARACATNQVALAVPCHRVVGRTAA